MKPEYIPFTNDLIELAIREDIGDGDHSSLACIPPDERGRMKLLVKQEGVLAGVEVAEMVLRRLDPDVAFDKRIEDGAHVRPGDVAFYVEGRVVSLLQAERILLNIMQRMSGVATQTARYVKELEGLKTRVLDTRKTTPGMRVLDKMAVKLGGGENHRMGLFDMVILKDNHIDFAGGITAAVEQTKAYLEAKGKRIPIAGRCPRGAPPRRRRPHHARQFHARTHARGRRSDRGPLRDRVLGRHHARQPARVRRLRRRLYFGRCVDASDQEFGLESESLLSDCRRPNLHNIMKIPCGIY